MKQFLVFLILSIFIGCTESKESIRENKTFKEVFNKSELDDMQLIFDFFNAQICENESINQSNDISCYNKFFNRMYKSIETNDLDVGIPFDNQLQLYKHISDSTFNEIWVLSWVVEMRSLDTLVYLDLNPYGKYKDFLDKLGDEYIELNRYHSGLITSGGISPGMFGFILQGFDSLNINDVRVRFVVAIHYLTTNDNYSRRELYIN